MTYRHAQAFVILECLRRRGIWVGLYRGEIDMVPPPARHWRRRLCELMGVLNGSEKIRGFRWEVTVWLRWERRQDRRQRIAQSVNETINNYFPNKGAP